jgi:hypothetical protein
MARLYVKCSSHQAAAGPFSSELITALPARFVMAAKKQCVALAANTNYTLGIRVSLVCLNEHRS